MKNSQPKIRSSWRVVLGAVALAIAAAEFAGYIVARDLNRSYFKEPSASLGLWDGIFLVVAAYLFVVALSGRWLGTRARP